MFGIELLLTLHLDRWLLTATLVQPDLGGRPRPLSHPDLAGPAGHGARRLFPARHAGAAVGDQAGGRAGAVATLPPGARAGAGRRRAFPADLFPGAGRPPDPALRDLLLGRPASTWPTPGGATRRCSAASSRASCELGAAEARPRAGQPARRGAAAGRQIRPQAARRRPQGGAPAGPGRAARRGAPVVHHRSFPARRPRAHSLQPHPFLGIVHHRPDLGRAGLRRRLRVVDQRPPSSRCRTTRW